MDSLTTSFLLLSYLLGGSALILLLNRFSAWAAVVAAPLLAAILVGVSWGLLGGKILAIFSSCLFPWFFWLCLFRPERGREWPLWWAQVGIWSSGIVLSLMAGQWLGSTGWFVPVLFIGLMLRYLQRKKESRTAELVTLLHHSMRQHIPLEKALFAAAEQEPDLVLRGVLSRLSAALGEGALLSKALEVAWPFGMPRLLSAVRVGEETDQVPDALERLYVDLQRQLQEERAPRPYSGMYLLLLFMTVVVITGINSIWVHPALAKMFANGGLSFPIPDSLRAFQSNVFGRIGLGVGLVLGAMYILVVLRRLVAFRGGYLEGFLSFFDRFMWYVPFQGQAERDAAMLHICETLRFGVRAGASLPVLLENMEALEINCVAREKLQQWRKLVNRGVSATGAIQQAGLGRSLAWAFDGPGEHIEHTLRVLEELHRNNLHHRTRLAASLGYPIGLLVLGTLIGLQLYTMFLPLFTFAQIALP
jgi:type II secretory pathway component PulF